MLSSVIDAGIWQAIVLTLQLAGVTTVLLLLMGIPLAWWLATSQSRWQPVIQTLVAMPLVLPPTVLGFYLLVAFSPMTSSGQWLASIGLGNIAFSFAGLVVGSMVYSLPFVVQPIEASFRQLDPRLLVAAQSLGASRSRLVLDVILPLCKPGFMTAIILGFAHTVGEFGVVLMIGGNIPGETRVLSIAIFEQVELMHYETANYLSMGLVVMSFIVLFLVYRQKQPLRFW